MIAAIIAIFSILWTRSPTISPITNGIIIKTNGGIPPMLPEVIKLMTGLTHPKSATPNK